MVGFLFRKQKCRCQQILQKNNAMVGGTFKMIPAQQPKFFDENGKSIFPAPKAPEGASEYDAFGPWIVYARTAESFKPSNVVQAMTYRPLPEAQQAAYDAPYPARIAMGGPRTWPGMMNDLVGIAEPRREALKGYTRPFLTITGANEPGPPDMWDGSIWIIANVPGAKGQPHHRYPDASHFVQEEKGSDIAKRIDAFIKANP
jgi:haloalkane dehalogenase